MSDQKISALPDGSPGQTTDLFVIARGGSNYKLAGSALGGALGGSLTASTDVVINSATGGVSGDIILQQNGTEFARWHNGKLGIGTTSPTWDLQIVPATGNNGLYINAPEESGAALDSMNIRHRSTGDAIFIPHLGGVLPATTLTADTASGSPTLSNVSSFAGLTVGTKISGTGIPAGATIASAPNMPGANQIQISANATATNTGTTISFVNGGAAGADSALNVLIPRYLDYNDGLGWAGTITNNRTGMRGLTIVTETVNDSESIAISHWSNNFAIVIQNQQGANAPGGTSIGAGGALQIIDSGTASSIQVDREGAPTSGNAMLELIVSVAGTWNAIKLWDGASTVYSLLDSTGFFGTKSLAIGGTVAPTAGTTATAQPTIGDSGNVANVIQVLGTYQPTNDLAKAATGVNSTLKVLDTNATGAFTSAYYGMQTLAQSNSATQTVGELDGIFAQSYKHGAGTVTSAYAIKTLITNDAANAIGTARSLMVSSPTISTGTITNNYGIFVNDQKPSGVGTGYGIYINTQTGVALHIVSGNIELGALNIVLDTVTGTKIGTLGGASGQKIGFWNATPVVQPVLATGASHTVDDVITVLQTLGLVRQS